ncbi:MAG TPA: glycosyltransferase, partial [Nitriliruptorales bacterium]|nr:glycosyltransferase [Nitriliruptorales bacterium]
DDALVVLHRPHADPRALGKVARPLADPTIDVSVQAEVSPPRLFERRRVEPDAHPFAVAVRRAAWEEVGGLPAGDQPLPGFVDRLRAAGRRFALLPEERPGLGPLRRADPITQECAAVILALVPMHDVGGGSRGAQLAQELLRWGFHVTYVALYGTAESVDLGIRYPHPALEQVRADRFDPDHLAERLIAAQRLAVVELPHALYLDHLRRLQDLGFRGVYDLIDDWTAPSLGGDWYRPEVERRLADTAHALVVSSDPLRERLEQLTGRTVALVPNAVNTDVFAGEAGPLPEDFPAGEGPVLGYHGSLYGDWFDWKALAEVATAFPDARVVLLGDAPQQPAPLPANVHLLGLKPQPDLPAYVHRFDVGLVPFVVSPVTHAVSPLKVYEYLACGAPVAAPPLRTLRGLPGVHTRGQLTEAVDEALRAPAPDAERILSMESWGDRVARVSAAAGIDAAAGHGRSPRAVTRPPVHYARRRRRIA